MSTAAAVNPPSTPHVQPEGIDLIDPDIYQASGPPHDDFARVRAEFPICWHDAPDGHQGFWAISKYKDIQLISRTPQDFSSARGGSNLEDYGEEDIGPIRMLIINMDPPMHVKYRKLISRGFTPRMIRALEPQIEASVTRLLDKAEEMGEFDFVRHVAAELPLEVLADFMGVPQEDTDKLFDWSNRLIGFDDPEFQTSIEDARMASMELWMYTQELVESRVGQEDDGKDLIRVLLNAQLDGERLTEADLNGFFLLLSVAGNETTRNAISGGTLALLEHPEQLAKLRANPNLIDSAVEEILRWVTPVNYFRRTLTRDLELGGVQMKENDKVLLFYHSANRDEEIFDDPQTFNIERTPNPHIAFGFGEHFCLGSTLARLELKIMFRELIKRFSDIEVLAPPRRLRSNFINGIKELQVRVTPASA